MPECAATSRRAWSGTCAVAEDATRIVRLLTTEPGAHGPVDLCGRSAAAASPPAQTRATKRAASRRVATTGAIVTQRRDCSRDYRGFRHGYTAAWRAVRPG